MRKRRRRTLGTKWGEGIDVFCGKWIGSFSRRFQSKRGKHLFELDGDISTVRRLHLPLELVVR